MDAVCGVRELEAPAIRELPPLLQGASNDFIEALALLDAQMLVILKSGWRLPEALWESLAGSTLPQVPPREIASGEISERP